MAFYIDHKIHQHWFHYIQQHGFDSDRCILMNDIDEHQDLGSEAERPQSLRSPILPSQAEQDTHSLTHQPFRSWCRVCQQAKGCGGQHRRQHQQEESVSIIQLDYTFMHDPHQPPQSSGKPHTCATLTAIESTTGLCTAALTSKKGYMPHQTAQLHSWIAKHSFTKSILQADAETALMQLVNTVSTDLKLPTRVSPPYSHQSQGKVERFRRNLFDQLRTTRLQGSKDLKTEPHMLPPEPLPWALPHTLARQNISSRTTAKTTAPTSLVLVRLSLETSATSRLKSYVSRITVKSLESMQIWIGRDLITNKHILALLL